MRMADSNMFAPQGGEGVSCMAIERAINSEIVANCKKKYAEHVDGYQIIHIFVKIFNC